MPYPYVERDQVDAERVYISRLPPSPDKVAALEFLSAIRQRIERDDDYETALLAVGRANEAGYQAYRRIADLATRLAAKDARRKFATAVKAYSREHGVVFADAVQSVSKSDPAGYRAYRANQTR